MTNLEFYSTLDSINSEKDLLREFQENLLETNRYFGYYVDFETVDEKSGRHSENIEKLQRLTDADDLKSEFFDLFDEAPEVLKSIPALVAERGNTLKVIEDLKEEDQNVVTFDFTEKQDVTEEEKQKYWEFVEKTGLADALRKVDDLEDYLYGVEAGLNTNARKNRSGNAMENLMEPLVRDAAEEKGLDVYREKNMGIIEEEHGLDVPDRLTNRQCDFIVTDGKRFVNIEVNYYKGSGSKPEEIVNSYSDRNDSLEATEAGKFIWVTDGQVWNTASNQLEVGLESMPYVLNVYFVRNGLLEEAFNRIFS